MARYGMDAKRPWALSDVDVVWQKDIAPLYEGDWDVGLMWRGNPAMPINATDDGDPELQRLAEVLGMTANA